LFIPFIFDREKYVRRKMPESERTDFLLTKLPVCLLLYETIL